VRVGHDGARFTEVLVAAAPELAAEADAVTATVTVVPPRARVPILTGAREWIHACGPMLSRGAVILIDYGASAAELVERGQDGWLRTYRGHRRGGPALTAPGEQDITIDLPVEHIVDLAARAGP